MNPELNYRIAQQRIADLQRASARLRIAREVRADKPNLRRSAWMAVAAVLVGAGWASNQFKPMLLVYRHTLGLGTRSLEAMFGVYALGLIPGLFLAGPLSDARGRRGPVLGLIQPAGRALDALRWRWSVGMVGLLVCAAGLVLGAYAVQVGSLWLLAPCAVVLGCAYGLCLVSGLIEVGRLARPQAVGSVTAVYYALAYLGFATPYLLTLASPLAGYQTLLLILAAVALTSAAVVASGGHPEADPAVGDARLAELDSSMPPAQPVLLAEVDGQL